MALKKCKECGKEVSSKADKCPNCGAPTKRKSIGCGGGLLVIIIIGIIGAMMGGNDTKSTKSTVSSPPKEPTEIVSNSAWDGGVYQVKRYLKNNLKDPDSFEAIEWSPVTKVDLSTHKYIVRCKYRAKNSFGGFAIENQLFYLDGQGNIVSVMKYN